MSESESESDFDLSVNGTRRGVCISLIGPRLSVGYDNFSDPDCPPDLRGLAFCRLFLAAFDTMADAHPRPPDVVMCFGFDGIIIKGSLCFRYRSGLTKLGEGAATHLNFSFHSFW